MYSNSIFIVSIIVCSIVHICESYNVLAIFPHLGKSHQLVFEPLFKKLIDNGHSVTLLTRFPFDIDSTNWRAINVAAEEKNDTEFLNFNLLTGTRYDRYWMTGNLVGQAAKSCSEGLRHPNVQNLLKEKNHFDVVLIEIFNTNCFMGIAKKYDAPVIGFHSAIFTPWLYQWFGVPFNPATFPSQFLGNTDVMNFLERVENTVAHLYNNLIFTIGMGWGGSSLSKEYVNEDLYENGDILNTVNMLMINTHYTLNLPIPLSPNVIEIGGIHVDSQPLKQLPQEIETFIDEAKHGVIYMSMGSTIQGDSLPEEKKQMFLKVFSQIPQRVIWKWEGEMVNKSSNILTVRWAPQRSILCHPNVKAYIFQSGLLSTFESVECGKPMLLLPLFGDQFTIAAGVEKVGGGLAFSWKDITEEELVGALDKLLTPEFAQSAQALSMRFKDRPLSPMNTALYWIDYVVKYKGAPFMKTSSVGMPIYQYLLLDVVAFLFIVLFSVNYILYLLCKLVVRRITRKQNKLKMS